jgi:hypothetical protein
MPNDRRKVRLTKKFATFLDGIDLSRVEAGDDVELSEHEAHLLIAEGWARPSNGPKRAVAADRPSGRATKRQRRKT